MELKDRINKILIENELNGASFSDIIGVKKSGIYKILRGETKNLNPETAKKITSKFSRYSYEWLMTNKESNLISNKNGSIEIREIVELIQGNYEKFLKDEDFVKILDRYSKQKMIEYIESK